MTSPPFHLRARLEAALAAREARRLDEAEAALRQVLREAPEHPEALHYLATLCAESGRVAEAVTLFGRLAQRYPRLAEIQLNLANALMTAGRAKEAAATFRRALTIDPRLLAAELGLAGALAAAGDARGAEAAWRSVLRASPALARAHAGLGRALGAQERYSEAAAAFACALECDPSRLEDWTNLGRAHAAAGAWGDAITAWQHRLMRGPFDAEVAAELAAALERLERFDEAFAIWREVVHHVPDMDAPWQRLAHCLTGLRFDRAPPELAVDLERAVKHDGIEPQSIAAAVTSYLSQVPKLRELLAAGTDVNAVTRALEPGGALEDSVLITLLHDTVVADRGFERLLTVARRVALDQIDGREEHLSLPSLAALASQCHRTEYIYETSEDEVRRVDDLAAASDLSPATLAIVAAYRPLATLGHADRLATRVWPEPIAGLIASQIKTVREETAIAAGLPTLTAIDDATSLAVRDQYESHPYPRWTRVARPEQTETLAERLSRLLPDTPAIAAQEKPVEILIAGCGTGRHVMMTALGLKGAEILAVDLSRASLAYAVRRAREYGLDNVQFALADLLHLPELGRQFDLIEAGGVLHHLADPLAGWRALVAMLRPGGWLRIGLYSALARRPLDTARAMLTAQDIIPTTEGLRRARRLLLGEGPPDVVRVLANNPDFYSASGCRDLLFHVMEHRLTLPEIARALEELGLVFLGFDISDPTLLARYRRRFPQDPMARDLDCWQRFETEHPMTFAAMYQFWVRKPA